MSTKRAPRKTRAKGEGAAAAPSPNAVVSPVAAPLVLEGEPAGPAPPAPLFWLELTRGYGARRIYELAKNRCSNGVHIIYGKDRVMRFLASSPSTSDASSQVFHDSVFTEFSKFDAGDEDFVVRFAMSDIMQRAAAVRRPDGLTYAHYEGDNTFIMHVRSERNVLSGNGHITIMAADEIVEPPPVPEDAPCIVIDVFAFSQAMNEFNTPKIKFVKVVMRGRYMDWTGYMDETTRVHENRFMSEETVAAVGGHANAIAALGARGGSLNAPDIPGSTFFLCRKDITALGKLKQLPPDGDKLYVRHVPGGPMQLCVNIAGIGKHYMYIINPHREPSDA